MKLTNSKFYLDFNSTSPLADSVKEYLARGDFSFANPSSLHMNGKHSKREINRVREFLSMHFSASAFDLFFHSGASEGINTIILGLAKNLFKENKKGTFYFFRVDHSCVLNNEDYLKLLGHKVVIFEINPDGSIDFNQVETILNSDHGNKFINFTWVNNETGVVTSLESIQNFLDKNNFENLIVHVDAVQSIGKISNFKKLSSKIDCYTYSGHKFGAMKGIGFSFFKDNFFGPMIVGGGQQNNIRSGTENVMAIVSMELALRELDQKFDYRKLSQAKEDLEEKLETLLDNQGEIVGKRSKRNLNTIFFLLNNSKSDTVQMALDMAGLEVGTGSACASGSSLPGRVLLAMGYSEDRAKSGIRISVGPYFNMDNSTQVYKSLESILKRFLN